MTGDSTPEDGADEDDLDGSIEMDDFELYGSPAPTSNGVSNAIKKLDRSEPERLTMIQIYDTKFEWKNWVMQRLGL